MPTRGQARWFYQFSPHDMSDYDGVNESVLVDPKWQGADRKILVHPDRNGYVYVLDRATGELLSASPYRSITSSKGVDLKTGASIYNDEKRPEVGKFVKDICPAPPGAKDWQPSAFSHKDRASLHSAQQPVHGHQGNRGRLHRGHAVRRR